MTFSNFRLSNFDVHHGKYYYSKISWWYDEEIIIVLSWGEPGQNGRFDDHFNEFWRFINQNELWEASTAIWFPIFVLPENTVLQFTWSKYALMNATVWRHQRFYRWLGRYHQWTAHSCADIWGRRLGNGVFLLCACVLHRVSETVSCKLFKFNHSKRWVQKWHFQISDFRVSIFIMGNTIIQKYPGDIMRK